MAAMLQEWRAASHHERSFSSQVNCSLGCPYTQTHAPTFHLVAMLTQLALVFVLALCNGFFALSEMALVASRKSRLKTMARTSRHAALALRHAQAPEHFLSTVQVGITLVTLITGALAGDALGAHFADLLQAGHAAWLAPYARVIGIVLGFVLISFIQIVIGELVPKRLALSVPEKLSAAVAVPMLVLSRITAPTEGRHRSTP